MPPHLSKHQMPQNRQTLQFMQVNVGRGGPANDLALAIAFEENTDILLIQEPWIGADLERELAKRHKGFLAYAPGEDWKERPRVITYVRHQTLLWSVEKRQDILKVSEETPDIMVLEIKLGLDKESVFVVNVYNPPLGAERAGKSADILINAPEIWQRRLLIIGDVNLHHTDWDNRTIHPTSPAQRFAEWVTDNNGLHQLEPGVATHAKRGTLDLVISSSSLSDQITECYVEPCFDVTSDHKTIVTRLELEKPSSKNMGQQKFQLDKMDKKKFVVGLEA